ncbi:MAG: hypothetical protein OXC97_06715, partial [Candidatus Dadabacteria bacterium]|nr:hypothetical protein [Candidatus Dadabacteria bacterium]
NDTEATNHRENAIGLAQLNNKFRTDDKYNNNNTDMYIITMSANENLSSFSRYPELFGFYFDRMETSPITDVLGELLDESGIDDSHCQTYGDNNRVACAEKVASPGGNITVIAGLHHGEDEDHPFRLPAECDSLDIYTRADEVIDESTLQAYVQQTIEEVQKFVRKSLDNINKS